MKEETDMHPCEPHHVMSNVAIWIFVIFITISILSFLGILAAIYFYIKRFLRSLSVTTIDQLKAIAKEAKSGISELIPEVEKELALLEKGGGI